MKILLSALLLLVTFPAVVGSAAASVATAPHPAPAARLFPWVPQDGYPDSFPYGQCTWWAAYNRRVTWNGNAADWLANARAKGIATSNGPSLGAIVVYARGGGYSDLYGHVGVVIGVMPGRYVISEMNVLGWAKVDTRAITWPDPHVEGFIPLAEDG